MSKTKELKSFCSYFLSKQHSFDEIANKLSVNPDVISSYRGIGLGKTGKITKEEVARFCIHHGIK